MALDLSLIPPIPWHRVDQSGGLDSCWRHEGQCGGYVIHSWRAFEDGKFRTKSVRLTRLILELLGFDMEGLEARHACDNQWCCNPLHLAPGSHADNMQDKQRRGRGRGASGVGALNVNWKNLDREEIFRLRELGWSQQRIADHVGCSQVRVSQILKEGINQCRT